MITKEAYLTISFLKTCGSRIFTVSFNGNICLTVIVVYSPTEAATDEDAEDFHGNL